MNRIIHIIKKDFFIALIIALSFIFFSIILPVYDDVNNFHNVFFDNYKLFWYDGRTPENFFLIKNIIENKSYTFPSNFSSNNFKVENNYDFSKIGSKYYPIFNIIATFIFSVIIGFIPYTNELQLFKISVLVNIIFLSFSLAIFYLIQRMLGLKKKYAFISSLFAGIASSFIIYSHYLFLTETMCTFILCILIYYIFKNWQKTSIKNDIFILSMLSFFTFLLLIHLSIQLILAIFLFFVYFLFKFKIIKSFKIIILAIIFTLSFCVVFNILKYNFDLTVADLTRNSPIYKSYYFFPVFPNYINALDYSLYGYHNVSSESKLVRIPSYIYGFSEKKGNAFFLFSSSFFLSLFGPKGFIFNSPFLIFSILGIFLYKNVEKRNFLLFIILFFIILVDLNLSWYGGVTPRYIRQLNIPILFLSFFSFYCIQENKNIFVRLFFVVLIVISTLNVLSLAVRTDWTYEHEADLVSYDWVLWPWIQPTKQENTINLYFTSMAENVVWKFGGESNCKAYGSLEGIVTYFCDCEFATYAERNIEIPWKTVNISFNACGRFDNRGTITGELYFNNVSKEIILSPGSCSQQSFVATTLPANFIALRLKSSANCTQEIVWKSIKIEET